MPKLSEAQEVNGARETDTSAIESDCISQDSSTISTQHIPPPVDNGDVEGIGPRLRKQDEVEIDSPPRLVPDSVLKVLGLSSQDSPE